MSKFIALKRLTASDSTLFEAVFRTIGAGNQKSINLNADVLTEQFYPTLGSSAAANGDEILLPIALYGPGAKPVHRLTRKIIKKAGYKNWRLNGEFIYGPPDDSTRYDGIQPGDIAILVFNGEFAPTSLDLIIVSRSASVDVTLHYELDRLFDPRSKKSMIAVSSKQIADAAENAHVIESHPVFVAVTDPLLESALEDAIHDGAAGIERLLKSRNNRTMTRSEFAKAKARSEQVGYEGENLISGYLAAKISAGKIMSFAWVASENAISPFDFEITSLKGSRILVDVKSTGGQFDNILHLSMAEVTEAANADNYVLYRVFELDDVGGKLKRSRSICDWARALIHQIGRHLPDGVRIDSFSIPVSSFVWRETENLVWSDEEEGV